MIHIEVRKKIIEARANGVTIKAIAEAYSCNPSSITRLQKQYKESGELAAKTHLRGRKPTLDTHGLETLRRLILNRPDITPEEIKAEMALTISLPAICKTINKKLGFRYKKRQYMLVNENVPTL